MILSVSMPLIFWTKMNDIRLRPLAIFFGWTPAKNHSPKPVKLTLSDHPFFAPVFGRSKMWWSDASLDGFCPKTKHVHWGSLAIAGACHFVSVPLFFLSSLDAHQDKNKSLPPSFYWLVKSLLATKQVCDFQRFRIVLLVSLHDVKNALRSPQNRSKLSA
ncbi:hypothetical protein J4731_18315 [Providencia rettgeri]|nr:hypothetical protein [Providencia rettgeri]